MCICSCSCFTQFYQYCMPGSLALVSVANTTIQEYALVNDSTLVEKGFAMVPHEVRLFRSASGLKIPSQL